MTNKKVVVYFDMDNVLVNFQSGIDQLSDSQLKSYNNNYDEVPGIFRTMKPYDDMVDLFNDMSEDSRYDCYILSTSPWNNPSAASDKVAWVQKYIPKAYKKLILSHNKHLNLGDFLIDDRTANGAGDFSGKLLKYGNNGYSSVSLRKYFNIN